MKKKKKSGILTFELYLGILFMGSAFHNGGILFSCFLLTFLAALTLICMLLLVSCWEKNKVSFGEIAEAAFGTKGKIFVDTTLVVAQVFFFSDKNSILSLILTLHFNFNLILLLKIA